MVENNPEMGFTPHHAESWHRAHLEEPATVFSPWDPGQPYPTSSMPALQASKCAEWQGEQAFIRYHLALYEAFFEKNQNISDPGVLFSLARECELDIDKFVSDFEGGMAREQVLAEYDEGHSRYEGWGVPLVIVGDRYPVVGAVPVDIYRRAIKLCLAIQTG